MSTNPESTKGPLSGTRVLDLAGEMGQYCTKLLADLGADVIKVEPPQGDPLRSIGPFVQDNPDPQRGLPFFYLNTSKRGVTLHLDSMDGRELFKRLAQKADILVETFQPGWMAERGIGYESLRAINPRLIMCSVTPFGQTGPYRDYQASDIVGFAMGGLMNMAGYIDAPPDWPPHNQAYKLASIHATIGTLIALNFRDVTGRGQHVDSSMQEAVAMGLGYLPSWWELEKRILKRSGGATDRVERAIAIWPCKDGYITGGAMGGQRGWDAMVEWMDSEGMAGDLKEEQWKNPEFRRQNQNHVDELWGAFLLTHTKQEVYERCQGYHLSVMPIQDPREIVEDPQLRARGYFADVEHPELASSITYPGGPFKLSKTPWRISRRPPLIGEHNLEIYRDELGLSLSQIEILKAHGVI